MIEITLRRTVSTPIMMLTRRVLLYCAVAVSLSQKVSQLSMSCVRFSLAIRVLMKYST